MVGGPAVLLAAMLHAGCGGGREEATAAPPAEAAAVDPAPSPAEPPPAEEAVYDRWESWGIAEGLPSAKVLAVLVERDRIWAGTEGGLACLRDGGIETWGPAEGLGHVVVTSLARSPRTGDLWIGTFAGLSRLSGGRLVTFRQTDSGLMNDVVYGVAAEGDRVWAATASGLSVLDTASGSWKVYDHTNAVFHEPWVYAVSPGGGRVWLGIWAGGVVEHDPERGTWREFRDPDGEMEMDLVPDDGPVHDVTSAVSFAEGILWQSTYFGAARFEGGRWRTFLRRDGGLPSDFVNSVRARGRRAFFSTDRGLAVTDGDAWTTYARRDDGKGEVRIVRPGREPEVRVTDTAPAHSFVFAADAAGREVWLGTAEGLSRGVAAEDGKGSVPATGRSAK